jgi:Leucine-rich repeat (LRR) protein
MGEDLPDFGALRDMKDPTSFCDPDRMLSPLFYCGKNDDGATDNGSVHHNSGVNNKLAYLLTDGDSFNGHTITGMGISEVADLYYECQTNLLTSSSDYSDLHSALTQAAINLGFTQAERDNVEAACQAVELNLAPCSSASFPISFPDPNLEAKIRAKIGKLTGDIYSTDLEQLTYLNAANSSITDLTGIEYCSHLTDISLYNNQISDISPLAGLTCLQSLNLSGTQISDLSPLAGLTNLQRLSLYDNQISDISPLAGLTNLVSLVLDNNQISDISPLAGLTNLQGLSLSFNQISNISPLVANPGISSGDLVNLVGNYSLSCDSINNILVLIDRGVSVWWYDDYYDSDSDGTVDCNDNCPNIANPDQDDLDSDGVGDVCDPECGGCGFPPCDTDNDGIDDNNDNCPNVPNGSSMGSCFSNINGDVWSTCSDDAECRTNGEWWIWCDYLQIDRDSDGRGDVCDNCLDNCNTQQLDADNDTIGDVCDSEPGCDGCGANQCESEC